MLLNRLPMQTFFCIQKVFWGAWRWKECKMMMNEQEIAIILLLERFDSSFNGKELNVAKFTAVVQKIEDFNCMLTIS